MRRPPTTTSRRREEPLGFMVASVGQAAAVAFELALAGTGLHPRHFAVLRGLAVGEAQSQQQLAKSLGIPSSRVVALLDELVKRGLVLRRDSVIDRRVKTVALLDAGRRQLTYLLEIAAESERQVSAGLSANDQAELRRLLGLVYDNVAVELDGVRARVW